jgi:hypothetical protein
MEKQVYHEQVIDKTLLPSLFDSSIALSEEVKNRYSPIKESWPTGYMKFAEGSPSTELYECYNVFLSPLQGFAEVYQKVIDTFKKHETEYLNYAVAGWVNVYHKGGNLKWHKHGSDIHEHDGRWHGYVAVNSEPSKTMYRDSNKLITTIDNKDGYITLSHAGLYHQVTEWELDKPRITIAFDFVLRNDIDPMNMTRWIPVI